MTVCEAPRLIPADVELLAHHLAEEIAAQQDVLRRLAHQERLLVTNDVNGLKQFLADSDPMLARLQALTEMRLRIMSLFARRLGVSVDSCTVARVLDNVDQEDRERLASAARELRSTLRDVDARTRRVNVLLRHAAETNEALLHGLLGGQAPLRTYQADGRRAPPPGLPHFARDF
jgi:hypothetical protein